MPSMLNKKIKLKLLKVKLHRHEAHLTLWRMLAFVLIFGSIGTYFLWKSFAAVPVVASIEAETMTIPAGASVVSDSTASSSNGILMTANATATSSAPLSFSAVANQITVRAKGVQCNGAPQIIVKVDNVPVLTTSVSSSGWTDYSAAVNLASGPHAVAVSFSNDFTKYKGGSRKFVCTRDLSVDKLTFFGASGDISAPSVASLTATPGDQQIALSWTAATDNVGVTKYEVWKDNAYVTGLTGDVRTYNVAGLTNGTAYSFRVVAYDAAGNYANSNTISATPAGTTVGTGPGTTVACTSTPAPFPSRLKAVGRNLVDENGCVMPKMKGFNIHASTGPNDPWVWEDAHFKDISANNGKVLRTVIKWNAYESTQGVINEGNLLALDKHIARAQRNGIYVILDLHLNVGAVPTWTTAGDDETEKYAIYGQKITQTLAQRYSVARAADGLTIDPRTVIGFNLNEPPQDGATINGNNSIPTFEAQQRQMIDWFRKAGSPGWIGFVSLAYANQKPQLTAPRISANPDAYDSVGGNVVFVAHDYLVYNDSTDPNTDSRQSNGALADTRFANPGAHWLALADPHSFPTDPTLVTRAKAQMKGYLAPFNTYADAAQMPLMVGEFGWSNATGFNGKCEYYKAKREAMNSVNSAIQLHWIYGTDPARDRWSAKSGTTWDPDVLAWLQAP